jgi:hypothetical protein
MERVTSKSLLGGGYRVSVFRDRKARRYGFGVFAIVLISVLLLNASDIWAAVDKCRIYFGDPYNFSNPGEISAYKVFSSISEFQQIKEEGIKASEPEYWILMRRANRKFKLALQNVNAKLEFDLIGELGCVRISTEVPDITIPVIMEIVAIQKEK